MGRTKRVDESTALETQLEPNGNKFGWRASRIINKKDERINNPAQKRLQIYSFIKFISKC